MKISALFVHFLLSLFQTQKLTIPRKNTKTLFLYNFQQIKIFHSRCKKSDLSGFCDAVQNESFFTPQQKCCVTQDFLIHKLFFLAKNIFYVRK